MDNFSYSSGSGNGTITATYSANTTTSQRVGTITVNGGGISKDITVTQAPANQLDLSPSNQDVTNHQAQLILLLHPM